MSRKAIHLPAAALTAALLLAALPSPAAAVPLHHGQSPSVLEQIWQWLSQPWDGANRLAGRDTLQTASAAEGSAIDPLGVKDVARRSAPPAHLRGVPYRAISAGECLALDPLRIR